MNARESAVVELALKIRTRCRRNPGVLVSEVTHPFIEDPSQINVLLTDLIFDTCKLKVFIPIALVNNNDICGIEDLILELMERKTIRNIAFHKSFVHYWPDVVLFFEYYWIQNWSNILQQNGQFDSYIEKLITMLCSVNAFSLRFISVQIRMKLVTAFLRNRACNVDFGKQFDLVREYAVRFLKKQIYDKDPIIWRYCMNEISEQWLHLAPEFETDDGILSFVVWNLKREDEVQTNFENVLSSVDLVYDLLRRSASRLSRKFVQNVSDGFVVIITSMIATTPIFEKICECCVLLRANFDDPFTEDLVPVVQGFLFDFDYKKAEAAAKFWVNLNILGNSPVASLRAIITFLRDRKSAFVDLAVDSLRTHCGLITDWKILIGVLLDDFEERLTFDEKEVLILMVAFAVQQSVSGNRPFVRMRNSGLTSKKKRNESVARKITEVFFPRFQSLLSLPWKNYMVIMKIITFFDFSAIDESWQHEFLHSCSLTYQDKVSLTTRICVLEIMKKMQHGPVRQRAVETIRSLLSHYRKQFINIVQNLTENSEKYRDDHAEQQSLFDDLVGILVLSTYYSITDRPTYETAVDLLKIDLPNTWNPVFVAAREVSVILCTRFIMQRINAISEYTIEEGKQSLDEGMLYILLLTAQLNAYHKNRLGDVVFCSLCELVKLLAKLPAEPQYAAYKLPQLTIDTAALYIMATIAAKDEPVVSKPGISRDDVRKSSLLKQYFSLIELDLLPLTHLYDVIRFYCNQDLRNLVEKPLIMFLKTICTTKSCETVSHLFLVFLVGLFESVKNETHFQNLLEVGKCVNDLFCAVKKESEDIVCELHKLGVDYATSNLKNREFINLLMTLRMCLNNRTRRIVKRYTMNKPEAEEPVIKKYVISLQHNDEDGPSTACLVPE